MTLLENLFFRGGLSSYSKCVEYYSNIRFVCFSPEKFVKIKNEMIYSYPMKGTIDASLPEAEQVLMGDKKEAAEHATIVDLIRNDLSRVAEHVSVDKYRYIGLWFCCDNILVCSSCYCQNHFRFLKLE